MKATILRRWFYGLLWVVPVALILLVCFSGTIMSQVEQPKYTVLESAGEIEVRQYSPLIVAEVEVRGERNESAQPGFSSDRRLYLRQQLVLEKSGHDSAGHPRSRRENRHDGTRYPGLQW